MAPRKKDPQGNAAALLCAAGAALLFLLPISNPDLFWHLSAAKKMLADGAFLRADWLSHTEAGTPWANFEWLTQLIWYAAHAAAGAWGLWALKVVVYAACGAALWRTLGLYTARPEAKGIGVLVWALSIMPANDLRPENVSLLFFLLLYDALERRRLGRGVVDPWWLVPLFALWANLHAGFVYGLLLLALYAAGELARSRGKRRRLPAAAGAAALAPLLNPYGWLVYAVPLRHARELGDLQQYLKEWQAASILSVWLWPFWALLAAAFGVVLYRYVRRRDVPLEHVAALSVYGLSAVSHVRTSVYFSCVAVPIAAAALSLKKETVKAAVVVVFAAAYAYLLALALKPLSSFTPFSPRFVPVGPTDFLRREAKALAGRKLFNPWHWGGYLGWHVGGDYPIFVDGRYIFHHWLKPYYRAAADPGTYGEFFDRHGVDVALLRRSEQYVQTPVETRRGRRVIKRPFYLFYLPRQSWALVYWDAKGMVFVRRAAVDETWLRRHEYRWFRPQDFAALELLIDDGAADPVAVAAEMGRYAAVDPDVSRGGKAWLDAVMRRRK